MCGVSERTEAESEMAKILFERMSNAILSQDTSEGKTFSEWINSWIVDFKFGTWEYCFYCGDLPEENEHVVPRSFFVLNRLYGLKRGLRTMSCKECNSILYAHFLPSLYDRCEWVNQKIRIKYRKILSIPEWTDKEKKHLSYSLSTFIDFRQAMKKSIVKRVMWLGSEKQKELVDQAFELAHSIFPNNHHLHNFLNPIKF